MTAAGRAKKQGGKTLSVKQIRSGIGFNESQKKTLKALGLGKIGRVRTHPDNDAIRGMIATVPHLVQLVDPGEGDGNASSGDA